MVWVMKTIKRSYTGRTIPIKINISRDGQGLDITGAIVSLTIKKNLSDSINKLQKNITNHIDAVNGYTEIVLEEGDTQDFEAGEYVFDIVVKFSDNTIYTLMYGEWIFIKSVNTIINE